MVAELVQGQAARREREGPPRLRRGHAIAQREVRLVARPEGFRGEAVDPPQRGGPDALARLEGEHAAMWRAAAVVLQDRHRLIVERQQRARARDLVPGREVAAA